MKKFLLGILALLMILQCSCVAAPATSGENILSNDDKNWHQILEERGRAPMLIMKNGKSGSNVT